MKKRLVLSEETSKEIFDALLMARGHIRGQLIRRATRSTLTQDTVDLLTQIERSMGALLTATARHDKGARARCSFCGRYTADICALESSRMRERARCDCGALEGWSGSFEAPTRASQWSVGIHHILGETP